MIRNSVRFPIIALDRFSPLLDGNHPSDAMSEWLEQVTRQANLNEILRGTGSPETAVTANPTQLYMDESGTAGNILYIKKSGLEKTGWILV
jgi:hypothetical protein